jgi:hypothetical protein
LYWSASCSDGTGCSENHSPFPLHANPNLLANKVAYEQGASKTMDGKKQNYQPIDKRREMLRKIPLMWNSRNRKGAGLRDRAPRAVCRGGTTMEVMRLRRVVVVGVLELSSPAPVMVSAPTVTTRAATMVDLAEEALVLIVSDIAKRHERRSRELKERRRWLRNVRRRLK